MLELSAQTVPTTTIDPMSLWTIDFMNLVTPRQALGLLHEFRSLLALICGDLIDLWDVMLVNKKGKSSNNRNYTLPIL